MIISEVEIIPIKPKNGLIAIGSLVLDGGVYLGSIGIHAKLGGGYRLTFPNKKIGDKEINIFHPINKEASRSIENALIKKVEQLFSIQKSNEAQNDRHTRNCN